MQRNTAFNTITSPDYRQLNTDQQFCMTYINVQGIKLTGVFWVTAPYLDKDSNPTVFSMWNYLSFVLGGNDVPVFSS